MVECKRVNTTFFPEEITSMILKKISEVAESYLGEPIKDAVITVPHNMVTVHACVDSVQALRHPINKWNSIHQ